MVENDVETMNEYKKKSAAVYMKCLLDYPRKPDSLFCFFEGEDYKYYRSRMLKYLNIDEDNIIMYECKGKIEVLKIYENLNKNRKMKKIFFCR